MSEYREAAAAAGKLGAFIEMLERVRLVVAAAARYEQDEQNAKDRLKTALEQAANAEKLTAEAREHLTAAQAAVAAAKAEAQQVALDAQADADRIRTEARGEASRIVEAAQSKLEIARREGAEVAQQKKDMQSALDAARAELDDVRANIEAAKAEARARFG